MYDERMLQFLSRLAEMHVDPTISDPARIYEIPDDEKSEDEGRPKWKQDDHTGQTWSGLYKDVGIFTEHEWHLIMCKCLASMGGQPLIIYVFLIKADCLSVPFCRNSTERCWVAHHGTYCRHFVKF